MLHQHHRRTRLIRFEQLRVQIGALSRFAAFFVINYQAHPIPLFIALLGLRVRTSQAFLELRASQTRLLVALRFTSVVGCAQPSAPAPAATARNRTPPAS